MDPIERKPLPPPNANRTGDLLYRACDSSAFHPLICRGSVFSTLVFLPSLKMATVHFREPHYAWQVILSFGLIAKDWCAGRAVRFAKPDSASPGSPATFNERFPASLPPTSAPPGALSPDDLEALRRQWLKAFMVP